MSVKPAIKLQRPKLAGAPKGSTEPGALRLFAAINKHKISVQWWEGRGKWIAAALMTKPDSISTAIMFSAESGISAEDAVGKLLEKLKWANQAEP